MIRTVLTATTAVLMAACGTVSVQAEEMPEPERPIAIELRTWSNWSRRAGGSYAWKVRFLPDGSARYSGVSFTERKGEFHAEDLWFGTYLLFDRLVEYLEFIDFAHMPSLYSKGGSDGSHVVIRVEYPSGAHEVDDYMGAGPVSLWMLSTAISDFAERVEWVPVVNAESTK